MKIRGPASAPLSHVLTRLGQFNPHPRFAAEMVPALWDAAIRYGIDPVVMVAQAGHETGWGRYTGLVPADFHNTCGLKLRDLSGFPNSEVTEAHARFGTWADGARAHAQHLMAYTQTPLPVADPIIDPRWVWVYGRKSPITDVEGLGGSWAPNPNYGNLVAATANKLKEGAPMVALMPGFEWVGGPRADGSTYIDGVPWRICLHTTETPPISRGGNPRYMAATHNTPPHIWYDADSDVGWQSVTLDRGAFALWNDGNPQTNRARCLQVELVGYAEEAAGWPDVILERIARRVVVPLRDFARSQGGDIDLSDAAVPLPGAIAGSASEYAPQRLDPNIWLYGPIGLCQHRHVPRNDHWDAGGLDTRRIAAYALGGTTPPTPQPTDDEDDDMLRLVIQRGTPAGSMHGEGTNWIIDGLDAYPISSSYTISVLQAHGVLMTFDQMKAKGYTYETDGASIQAAYRVQAVPEGVADTFGPPKVDLATDTMNTLGRWENDTRNMIAGWHTDTRNTVNAHTDTKTAEVIANANRLAAEIEASGGGGEPVKVVDVEGSIAKATTEQLAKAGVARLREAILEAVMAGQQASPTDVAEPPQ